MLCREIIDNQEHIKKSGVVPSESLESLVRYYTMFRYSFEDFRTLYKVHYLPAAKAAGITKKYIYIKNRYLMIQVS